MINRIQALGNYPSKMIITIKWKEGKKEKIRREVGEKEGKTEGKRW